MFESLKALVLKARIVFIAIILNNFCARPTGANKYHGDYSYNSEGISASCQNYSTAVSDSKTKLDSWPTSDTFDLFWMGQSDPIISFWSNAGENKYFKVTRDPTSIVSNEDPRSKARVICEESLFTAKTCIENFDFILYEMNLAYGQIQNSFSSLTVGKQKTFACVSEFLRRKIAQLEQVIITGKFRGMKAYDY